MLSDNKESLNFRRDSETVTIEPWGPNALRVRAIHESLAVPDLGALLEKPILEEYSRHWLDLFDPKCSALNLHQREFKAHLGGDYHLTAWFESLDPKERIYGMGMYQQPILNLKGADLEIAHRNSQATVPFAVSSLGYIFLCNNPGIGSATFGSNLTTFEAYSTKGLLD